MDLPAHGSGPLSFSAVVTSPQGARSYAFNYQLIGGAAPLGVDAKGQLSSDTFAVSRATIVGADGKIYEAGPWQLAPGVASASIDDRQIPAAAYPYLIDPIVYYNQATNYARSYYVTGAGYPPSGGVSEADGTTFVIPADDYNAGAGTYSTFDAPMRWDTSSIPTNASVYGAALFSWACLSQQTDANENLYANWMSGVPFTAASMYPPSTNNPALGTNSPGSHTYPIGGFGTAADSNACLQGLAEGVENIVYLDNVNGITRAGQSALQLYVSNRQAAWPSTTAPTGGNLTYLVGYNGPSTQKARLVVAWYIPTPAPTQVAPAAGATGVSLTPTLQVNPVTDPDGDPVSYRFSVATDAAGSNQIWATGWGSGSSTTVPPGAGLTWNQAYYWQACSWDSADPTGTAAAPYGGACSPWSGFQTLNAVPPTPSLNSPPNGVTVTSTTPQLAVNPVTDPDGDPVSYWFRVATGTDGQSGALVESGWIPSSSWTPPPGSLPAGATFSWIVMAEDSRGAASAWSAPWSFHVDLRLGSRASFGQDSLGPVTVNLANGNAMATYSSPAITTVGGPLGVSFAYNSDQAGTGGLLAQYYADTLHQRSFGSYQAALTRSDPQIDFVWPGAPDPALGTNWYLARWSGNLTLPSSAPAASYTFGAASHDGVRVWVNNTLVLDHWVDQPAGTPVFGTSIPLSPGQKVPIRVEYYDAANPGGQMQLYVQGALGAGGASVTTIVPATWFLADSAALPDGWNLSADPSGASLLYTSAILSTGQAVLSDTSGATHVYTRTGSGFTPPPDEDGVLTMGANNLLTMHAQDGGVYTFNSDGTLATMTSATDDAKPAAPSYTWSGTPARLRSVTDPVSGRSITLSYGGQAGCSTGSGFDGTAPNPPIPAGMLCMIDSSAFGRGVTNLYYVNGHLGRIEDPGAAGNTPLWDFGYDSLGRLIAVRDVLTNDLIRSGAITDTTAAANMTQVGYDTSGRAASLTAPVPDAVGSPAPSHTYGYSTDATATTVSVAGTTQPSGYTRKVTLDPVTGQVTADTDAAGDTTSYVWRGDLLLRSTDPTGMVSTTIYDQANRPTDSYGPAAASEFPAGFNVSPTAPHSTVAHDEAISGLAATYWSNSLLGGAPAAHGTGVGDPSGALNANWGTTPPSGILSGPWSGRFTGEIAFNASGTYGLRLAASGTAALFVDDIEIADQATAGTFTAAAGPRHRIRVDYTPTAGAASLGLYWTPPGGSDVLIPGSALAPRYGLVTSKTDADGKKTATLYTAPGIGPELGLATAALVDPAGLALRSTTTYEAPGTGFLRPIAKALPKGISTTVTDAYYANTEVSTANTCTAGGVNQGGMLKTETGAGPNPVVHAFAYDASGRVIATEVVGDPAWTCTVYDARGRISSSTDSSGKTTTFDYTNPAILTTSYTDSLGQAETTSMTVDWLGRQISYTDEQATVTTSTYDQASRLVSTARTIFSLFATALTSRTYDTAGRVLSVTDLVSGSPRPFGFTYDAAGRLTGIQRPNGVTTSNTYDPARGRLTAISNKNASGTELAPSSYAYSPGGRITNQTTEGVASGFTYDGAARLVTETAGAGTRTYGYDANSNRCSTTSTTCGASYTYTAADRITASPGRPSYTYDSHGNITAFGTETITYDANNHATTMYDGTTQIEQAMSPSGRALSRYTYLLGAGAATSSNLYGYDGPGDSPSYTFPYALGQLSQQVTTYVNGPGGLLLIDLAGTPTYPLANAHGDIVGTTDANGVFTANATTDAFGVGTPPANGLGWLGNNERFASSSSPDLVRMGVRLYDPSLGRFLEVDPVPGGCSNDYAYVFGDPVNSSDISGQVACHNFAYNTKDRTARLEIRRTGVGAYVNGKLAVEYYIEFQPRAAYRGSVDYGTGVVTGPNPYSSRQNVAIIGNADTRNHGGRISGTRSVHFRFLAVPGTMVNYDVVLAWQDRAVGYGSFLGVEWWQGGTEVKGTCRA